MSAGLGKGTLAASWAVKALCCLGLASLLSSLSCQDLFLLLASLPEPGGPQLCLCLRLTAMHVQVATRRAKAAATPIDAPTMAPILCGDGGGGGDDLQHKFSSNQFRLTGVVWPCPWSMFTRFAANGYCFKCALSCRFAQEMDGRMTHECRCTLYWRYCLQILMTEMPSCCLELAVVDRRLWACVRITAI